MFGLPELLSAVRDILRELTDIVGLVEKNLASYDRIEARFRRKRVRRHLEDILVRLGTLRRTNAFTLWKLAEELGDADRQGWKHLLDVPASENGIFNSQLRNFLHALLATSDVIAQYRSDLVARDYLLFEKIEDAFQGRINLLKLILNQRGRLSKQKLREIYAGYLSLAEGVTKVKDELDALIKQGDELPGD